MVVSVLVWGIGETSALSEDKGNARSRWEVKGQGSVLKKWPLKERSVCRNFPVDKSTLRGAGRRPEVLREPPERQHPKSADAPAIRDEGRWIRDGNLLRRSLSGLLPVSATGKRPFTLNWFNFQFA